MIAEPIVDGVFGLRLGIANAFLIRSADGGVTLIDTGIRRRLGRVAQGIREAFGQSARLSHIVITHHHADHTGSIDQLVALTGAAVYVHEGDAPYLDGRRRPGWTRRITPALMGFGQPEPVPVLAVEGSQILEEAGNLRVIHTPGHTSGHISLLLASSRGNVLFAGDAAGEFFGHVGPAFPITNDDSALARASFANLEKEDFDVACFGHGRTITSRAHRRFFGR